MARPLLEASSVSPRLGTVLVIVVAAASLAGCATPAPIVHLEPRNPKSVTWVSGRAVLEKEQAGVRVATAFELQDGARLGLRLEIENQTEAAFVVDPRDVTFMICQDAASTTCSSSYRVVDPEEILGALDEQQARARADAANDSALNGSLVLLSAVTDVATIASGRADRTTGLQTVAIAASGEATAARHEGELASFGAARELWSNAALRRTTLAPGRGVAGLVYLPIALETQYLWLHVSAGGQTIPFGFRQIVRQIRTRSRPSARPELIE